jgi:hypothetical protein
LVVKRVCFAKVAHAGDIGISSKEQVGGLEVAMNDAFKMQLGQAKRCCTADLQDFLDIEPASLFKRVENTAVGAVRRNNLASPVQVVGR